METKTKPKRRIPLYKRRKFWGVALLATVLAAGVALFFFVQETPVKDSKADGRGVLSIDTEPDDATILIDGKERRERTDAEFSLPTGKHDVTLRLAGYDEAVIPVEIEDDHTSDRPMRILQTFTRQGQTADDEPVDEYETYRNKKYGYSLRYPSRWEFTEQSGGDVVVFLDTAQAGAEEGHAEGEGDHDEGEHTSPLTVLAQANPRSLGPEAWYKAREEYPHEDQSQIERRRTTVNGLPAYQYETPYGFTPYLITVVTEGDNAFLFQQVRNSPDRKLYDQVLGTLTF
ncbi:MAG: PEGA domain-containing protein [Patescibacteria group bacterium]